MQVNGRSEVYLQSWMSLRATSGLMFQLCLRRKRPLEESLITALYVDRTDHQPHRNFLKSGRTWIRLNLALRLGCTKLRLSSWTFRTFGYACFSLDMSVSMCVLILFVHPAEPTLTWTQEGSMWMKLVGLLVTSGFPFCLHNCCYGDVQQTNSTLWPGWVIMMLNVLPLC